MFCKHEFIKDKNNLYCKKCGKYVRMTCDHKWKDINTQIVINRFDKRQEVCAKECEICGKIIHLNLTTGEID